MTQYEIGRRRFVVGAGATALGLSQLASLEALAAEMKKMGTRPIPSTGERLPMVGVGTSRVFNVTLDKESRARLGGVLKVMLEAGGTVIDTANGYRRAEGVAGRLVTELGIRDKVFIATKIGANDREDGLEQIRNSLKLFNTNKIELMQIHNLRDWRTQIKTLRAMKEKGVFKYIGVTHYSTEPADEILHIIGNEKIDFFQFPYSIDRRDGEKRIMPLAQEKGVAILTHRNFGRGYVLCNERRIVTPRPRILPRPRPRPSGYVMRAPNIRAYCARMHPGSFVNRFRATGEYICTQRTRLQMRHYRINMAQACMLSWRTTSFRYVGGRNNPQCIIRRA